MLFSELVLLWSLSNYLIGVDQVPTISDEGTVVRVFLKDHKRWIGILVLKGIISAIVAGSMSRWESWLLPLFMFIAIVGLPLLRAKINPTYIAELEAGADLAFILFLAELIGHFRLGLSWALFTVDMSSAQIAVSSLIVAILLFSLRGGTYIVRSILDKTGTLPPLQGSPFPNESGSSEALIQGAAAKKVDLREYGRGRMIGNLERLLLIVIVVAGSYQALAFLAAAKGLIRSKNLENRDWAEYFLVGSLGSVMVSIVAGLLIGQLLKYW